MNFRVAVDLVVHDLGWADEEARDWLLPIVPPGQRHLVDRVAA